MAWALEGMDVLTRIKRLVFHRSVRFSFKGLSEMEVHGLEPAEVLESILNAQFVDKTIRSRSPRRRYADEKLHLIKSFSFSLSGTLIYTKGAIAREEGEEVFYVLVSAKIATAS